MAIIWQSTWFWVMLSAVLLLMLGSIAIKLNKPNIQLDSQQIMTATTPFHVQYDTNPLYNLQLDPENAVIYDDIIITQPTCYDLARSSYSCLGQIQNNSEHLIGDTAINVQFYNAAGENLVNETVTIEQRLIPSQSWASYRVIFNTARDSLSEHLLNDDFIVNSMINTLLPPAKDLQTLTVNQHNLLIADNRYHITATIENNTAYLAENIRLFTTLSNTEWGIVGYDVHEVEENIENGLSQTVNIEIIPYRLASELDVRFHTEALITDNN